MRKITRSWSDDKHIFNAVEDHGARRMEEDFILVMNNCRNAKRPAGEAAKASEPGWQAGQVVEGEDMSIVGGDHEIALLARQRSRWRGIRSTSVHGNF
jgi:hypothetical protein